MNAFYFKQRLSARVLAVLALFSLIAAMLPMQAFAGDADTDALDGKVFMCHANENGGYDEGKKEVAIESILGAHNGHDDGGADGRGDIIPSFSYTTGGGPNAQTAEYPGKNWDAAGQAIFDARCLDAVDPDPVTATVTVTKTLVNAPQGVTADDFAFEVDDGADVTFEADGSNDATVNLGTYSITEVGETTGTLTVGDNDYTVSYSAGCSGTLTEAGATCTITNTFVPDVPEMCTVTIVSDDSAFVVEKSANAFEITPHPAWTANISGASWIWGDATVVDGSVNETQTFRNQFGFVGNVTSATLEVASDNTHSATVNGGTANVSVDDSTFDSAASYDVTSAINESGNNELNVAVTNTAFTGENPAGALYKLTIEGEVTTDDDCMVDYVDPATLGTLEVTKVVMGTTTVDESAFSFKLNGGATTTFEADGTNTLTVAAGTHDVVETAAPGYSVVSTCDDVVVTAGQTSTCTITNTVMTTQAPVCEMGTNLLQNGSFETPVADANAFGSGFFELFDTVANWVISNTEATPMLELWNNMFGGASDGDQNAELDGNESTTITQTVATTPGATYELSFDFSARPGTNLTNNSIGAYVNGVSLITANGDGTGTSSTDWMTNSMTFVATSTAANITFADLGASDGLGSLLDNAVLCMTAPAPTEGTLNVIKTVVGTTTVDESAFSFTVNGAGTTTFDGTDGTNTLTLAAGTYDIVETAAPGYTASYSNCDDVVVTAGETSTCTITNTVATPQVCTVNVFSDTSTTVDGSSTFAVGNEPGAWADNIIGSLAEWIWSAVDGSLISGDTDETDTFVKTFEWDGPVTSATLKLAADNMYSVTLNGTVVGSDSAEDNYSSVDTIIDISDNIIEGTNTLQISVTNDANGATTLDGNPAGLIYDLTVNGNVVDDCTPGGGNGGGDVLSCEISASDTSIRRNQDVVLTFSSLGGATSAVLTGEDGATTTVATNGTFNALDIDSDTTFTLAVSDGTDTASCSVFVNTSSGGGGGGGGGGGRVLGDSDSNDNDNDRDNDDDNNDRDDDDDDSNPSGDVLGDQVSAIPTGAPNAGAGGSSTSLNFVTMSPVAFLRRS